MENINEHTTSGGHEDPNNEPAQHDNARPKPIADEQPMTTPEVSKRTPQAQYPGGTFIPENRPQVENRRGLSGRLSVDAVCCQGIADSQHLRTFGRE